MNKTRTIARILRSEYPALHSCAKCDHGYARFLIDCTEVLFLGGEKDYHLKNGVKYLSKKLPVAFACDCQNGRDLAKYELQNYNRELTPVSEVYKYSSAVSLKGDFEFSLDFPFGHNLQKLEEQVNA
ncbi:MAG: hypothetical protein LBD99_04020 [Candidatus Margulisbacteria bacterium]|jgi:hypothetical protein|nr:hypothetical protein [Candidatus Margulisiibacteriota bacterium]